MINIEVVYANPKQQTVLQLEVAKNTTVQQAIELSRILEKHPEINLNENKVGIFSEFVTLETTVSEGDRIEIYRPLKVDPMEARRLRAKKNKT